MSGRNPPSYCTLTLIAMQGHQQKGRQNDTSSNNKDKYNTIIIEIRTAEDHDDENLHNPETVQDVVIHLEVDERVVLSLLFGGPHFYFTYYVMYVLIPGIDVIRGVESLLRETNLMSRGPPVTCLCD